jgi:hypothetical protein
MPFRITSSEETYTARLDVGVPHFKWDLIVQIPEGEGRWRRTPVGNGENTFPIRLPRLTPGCVLSWKVSIDNPGAHVQSVDVTAGLIGGGPAQTVTREAQVSPQEPDFLVTVKVEAAP